ncbi:MAG: hypothetical protein K8R36_15060 [Planctomycetales bacterium]|nr:hypothetical protein [Planctomycetales bacterium]
MTTVSCPKCHDQVSVPSSAPRSARVRCPLCQEEYDLADALAQLPPALIIVNAAVTDEPVLAAVGGMDAATGSHIGSELDHGFESHLEGGSSKEYSTGVLDASPSREGRISAPTPSFRAAPRPKRKEKSMVGELVKIVLGGVVGIGLAILILWWGPGVDLGLAPTIAKVSWMRWVLPPKILEQVDKNQGNKEENPEEPQPANTGKGGGLVGPGETGDEKETKPSKPGKLGDDPRFSEALKNSGSPKASGNFAKSEKAKGKAEEKDPLDTSDPFAPETKTGDGELKIDSPLGTEPKATTKKPEPAKTKPATTEEPSTEDPFKLPEEKPAKPAKPVEPREETPAEEPTEKPKEEKPAEKPKEETPAEEKPATEKPKEEKPEVKPAEPTETPAKEAPVAAANLTEGIDAANAASKAFDATDAGDKEARKTAIVALYTAYAGLGRAIEQVNLEDADNAEKLPALKQSLAQAANESVKLNSIGALAARKLDAADGDPGILLAGTVKDLKAAGGHFETTLELVRDKRLVTVISAKNPQDSYKIDDQVLILGSIVRDPKEKLAGYKGDAAVVIKSGHAMVLPAPQP